MTNPVMSRRERKRESSLGARLVALLSVSVILLSIVVFCVETLPQFSSSQAATVPPLKSNSSHPVDDAAPPPTTATMGTVDGRLHVSDPFFVIETVCIVWFTSELTYTVSAGTGI